MLVDGIDAGKAWRLGWQRPSRELWVWLWAAIDDVGLRNISSHKVKAHGTLADAQADRITA